MTYIITVTDKANMQVGTNKKKCDTVAELLEYLGTLVEDYASYGYEVSFKGLEDE